MVKRIIKCCSVFAVIALLLLGCLLPAYEASAVSMGDSYPIVNDTYAVDVPLYFSGVMFHTDPLYWCSDMALPNTFNPNVSGFGDGYHVSYPDLSGRTAFNILQQAFIANSRTFGYVLECFAGNMRFSSVSPMLSRPGSFIRITPMDYDCNVLITYTVIKPNVSDTSDNFDVVYTQHTYQTLYSVSAYSNFGFSLTSVVPAGGLISSIDIQVEPMNYDDANILHTLIQVSATPISGFGQAALDWANKNSFDVPKEITVVTSEFPTDWGSWLLNACSAFFDTPLFGTFSIGGLLSCILGVCVLWFILHMFM